MTRIVLVRHGATDWSGVRYLGRSDRPLTDAGIEGARATADALARVVSASTRIVSSPSGRARTTAEIIAAALGRDATTGFTEDPAWAEQDVGDAEGLTFDEVAVRFPALARDLVAAEAEIDWPGGETGAAFRARVTSAWATVTGETHDTIVVSHAGPIRLAVALATGRPETEVAFPAPASATVLEVEDGVGRVVSATDAPN